MSLASLFEQVRVRACSHKDDGVAIHAVDEEEVASDVTFAVVDPITFQRVIQPLWTQRRIVAN